MNELWAKIRLWRDHRWTPDRLSGYLDGELAADERARGARHIGECVECRRAIAGLRLVGEALRGWPAPGRGPDAIGLAGSVRLRLQNPEPSGGSRGSQGA